MTHCQETKIFRRTRLTDFAYVRVIRQGFFSVKILLTDIVEKACKICEQVGNFRRKIETIKISPIKVEKLWEQK